MTTIPTTTYQRCGCTSTGQVVDLGHGWTQWQGTHTTCVAHTPVVVAPAAPAVDDWEAKFLDGDAALKPLRDALCGA